MNKGLPLTMMMGDKAYYYLTNYRGDVLALLDENGTVVAEYTYDAWGNILTQTGELASVNPYRYAGYRYDEETKLYYLIARYYNPDTGVFLSLDPEDGDITNPITMNGYNYANNNPVMVVDPNGHKGIKSSKSNKSKIKTKPKAKKKVTTPTKSTKSKSACNCFTAGTKVLTEDGEKNIEDIEVGDKVLAKSEFDENGELAYKEVTALYTNYRNDLIKLYIGDLLIETTDNHPFWVEGRGWVFADELKAGDKLQKADGSHLTIDQVEFVLLDEPVMVYNFTVADYHTYYVTDLGIWVHNTSCANITWKGFSSGSLKKHWQKHGHEFGKITQNDYLKLAKGFAAETNSSFKEQVVGNFLVKYDPKTGRVLVGHIKDRQIRTFYKDDGRSIDPFKSAIELAKKLGGG